MGHAYGDLGFDIKEGSDWEGAPTKVQQWISLVKRDGEGSQARRISMMRVRGLRPNLAARSQRCCLEMPMDGPNLSVMSNLQSSSSSAAVGDLSCHTQGCMCMHIRVSTLGRKLGTEVDGSSVDTCACP